MTTTRIFKYAFLTTVLTMAACNSEDESLNSIDSSKAIAFSTYIQQGSRAVNATDKTTFAEGDIIGLYACQTTGDYTDAFTANFMNNVQVTKGTDGSWSYSPLKAWPTDDNEHLSFIAYYPYSADATALKYTYTVDDDITKQTDLLWCTIKDAHVNDRNGTAINGTSSDEFTPVNGAIPLKFRHLLAKIVVNIKLAQAYPGTTAKLKSLTLNDVCKTGDFILSNDLSTGSWSISSYGNTIYWTSYTLHASTNEALMLNNNSQKLGQLFLIPQDVYYNNSGNEKRDNTCFEVTYTHTLTGGGEREITKSISLPNSWEMDKVYNYTISLSLDVNDITINADVLNRSEEVNNSANNTPAQAVDLGLSVKWASHDFGIENENDQSPVYDNTEGPEIVKNWGSNWTVPTYQQWEELKENCTITEKTIDGVDVVEYKSNINNNSISFKKKNAYTKNYNGHYFYMSIDGGYCIVNHSTILSGYLPIRPVTE